MSHIETNSGLLNGTDGVVEFKICRDFEEQICVVVMSPDDALRFAARVVAHAARARDLEDALDAEGAGETSEKYETLFDEEDARTALAKKPRGPSGLN